MTTPDRFEAAARELFADDPDRRVWIDSHYFLSRLAAALARVHNDAIEAAARVGIAHESGPVNECTLLAETIRALKVPQ